MFNEHKQTAGGMAMEMHWALNLKENGDVAWGTYGDEEELPAALIERFWQVFWGHQVVPVLLQLLTL